jgi:hypothetical protein
MRGAGGDKKLLPNFQPMYLTVHFKFFLSFDQHHQLIGFMDEVSPHSARHIDPQVAGKAARTPTLLNSFLIDRCHKSILAIDAKDVKWSSIPSTMFIDKTVVERACAWYYAGAYDRPKA